MVIERTYRGVSAEERRAQRHRQLLDATLDIWGHEDRPRITMTGVCNEAGLTERYFYESFAHLDVALVELLDEIATEIEQRTVTELHVAGDDPLARVRAVTAAFVGVLTDDPRKGRVALVEAPSLDVTRARRDLMLRRLARLSSREARKLHGPTAWAEGSGVLVATMFVGGVVQLVLGRLDGSITADPVVLVDAAARSFAVTSQL